MVANRAMGDDRLVDTADLRNRPVVLESGAPESQQRRRLRPRTIIGVSSAAVLAAIGLVAGSWSIWSAVSTSTPAGPPAPLWFSPPGPVVTPDGGSPAPASSTDDHGGTSGNSGNSGTSGTGSGADDHGGGGHEGRDSGSGPDRSSATTATTAPGKPTTNAPATPPPSGHSGPGRGMVPTTTKDGEDGSGGDHRSGKG